MLAAEVDGESWGTNDSGRGTVLEVEKSKIVIICSGEKGAKLVF